MCIIAYQPAGSKTLTADAIRTLWTHNPDGAGYAFALDGAIILRKPFWHLRDLQKAYAKDHAAYGARAPFVVHLRVATHGGKTEQNTHPHIVGRGRAVVAHNGIIHCAIPNPAISDTVAFCRANLERVRVHRLVGQPMRDDLARRIGAMNKLVILADDGTVSIVNEDAGIWKKDVWYSNTYSLESFEDRSVSRWSSVKGWKGAPRYYQPRKATADDLASIDAMRRRIAQTLGCTAAELTDDEQDAIERAAMDLADYPDDAARIMDDLSMDLADAMADGFSDDDSPDMDGMADGIISDEWTDKEGRHWQEYIDGDGRPSVRRVF